MNGRVYETSLSPVHAFYLVPEPPTLISIGVPATNDGLYVLLSSASLYFLFLILYIIRPGYFTWLKLVFFSLAIAVGNFLAADQMLIIPDFMGLLIPLILATISTIGYLRSGIISPIINHWITIVSLGLIIGASLPVPESSLGLTESEMMLTIFFRWAGLSTGLLLMYQLIREGVLLVKLYFGDGERWLVYGVGIGAVGWLLYESSLFIIAPSLVPQMILYGLVIPVLLGILATKPGQSAGRTLWFYCAGFATGLFPGLFGLTPTIVIPVIMGSVVILIMLVQFNRSGLLSALMVGLIGAGTGWATGYYTELSQSYAIGHTLAYWLYSLVLFAGTVSVLAGSQHSNRRSILPVIMLTIAATGLVILYAIDTFANEFSVQVTPGKVPLPVLSILLLLAAFYFWPRKRKIHQEMKVSSRAPFTSGILIALAMALLPFAAIKIQNPLAGEVLTNTESARLLLQGTLRNTYESFNIEDEDELFEQLSSSVDDRLIDEVYLDSRRRLNAGVRQGAEVRIRNVEVLSVDNIQQKSSDSYEYDAEWVVVARVKHLQHIHFRRNKYLGTIQNSILSPQGLKGPNAPGHPLLNGPVPVPAPYSSMW